MKKKRILEEMTMVLLGIVHDYTQERVDGEKDEIAKAYTQQAKAFNSLLPRLYYDSISYPTFPEDIEKHLYRMNNIE